MLKATFDVLFTAEAEKHYNALEANMKRRVNRAIALLAQNPLFAPNVVKLKGKYGGQYPYRVGSYRIVYSVDTMNRECIIIPFRLNNSAYRAFQLYYYDTAHTNCCSSHQTRRRGILPRLGKT